MIIEELDLSVRAYNCLGNAGIKTVAELIQWSPRQLNHIKNLGRHTLTEITEVLAQLNLKLKDWDDGEWQPTMMSPAASLDARIQKLTDQVELLAVECRNLRAEMEATKNEQER